MRLAQIYPHARIAGRPLSAGDAISVVQLELCRELAARHRVLAVVRRFAGEPPAERAEGFDLLRLSVTVDRLLGLGMLLDRAGLLPSARPFRTHGLYYRVFAQRTLRGLRRFRPDIAHLHGVPTLAPVLSRGLPAAPLVLHVHDHSLAELDAGWARRCLAAADLVLCCSEFVAQRLRRRFPPLAARIEVLHNAADASFFRVEARPDAQHDVLFVGRLAPEKGVHLLLEAFARIAGDFPHSRLLLVGPDSYSPPEFVDPLGVDPVGRELRRFTTDPGAYRRHLRRLAAALGDRVVFRGALPNTAVAEVMREAALLVFPSLWHEPFGMPVVEAMAAGLPVVATRAGAFVETVDPPRTGLLVARGDVDELAAALAGLLADPSRRAAMGAAGRERASRLFTWPAIAERLEAFYASARQAWAKARARADTSATDAPAR